MPYQGDPSGNPIDAVRYELGDTGTPELLNDSEIQYEITRQAPLNGADPLLVAASCAESIASRYAGEVSITSDGVSYSGDQLQQKYTALAQALRQRYDYNRGQNVTPVAGGIGMMPDCLPGVRPGNFNLGMTDNVFAGFQRPVSAEDELYVEDAGDALWP
jgi:hypothetical protein